MSQAKCMLVEQTHSLMSPLKMLQDLSPLLNFIQFPTLNTCTHLEERT